MTATGYFRIAATALAAATWMGLSGSVQAGVMAYSYNSVNNIQINGSGITSHIANPADFLPFVVDTDFKDSSTSASLTGHTTASSGSTPDAASVCLGGNCSQTENVFGTAAAHLAHADAVTTDTPQGSQQEALVNLGVTATSGAASSATRFDWFLDWDVSGGAGGNFSLSFNYAPIVQLILDANAAVGSSAAASQSLQVSLYDGGGTQVGSMWNVLTGNWSRSAVGSTNVDFACPSGGCTATHDYGFLAADYYELIFEMSSTSNATFVETTSGGGGGGGGSGGGSVPEPATLALLGLGLLGLGLTRRRLA